MLNFNQRRYTTAAGVGGEPFDNCGKILPSHGAGKYGGNEHGKHAGSGHQRCHPAG